MAAPCHFYVESNAVSRLVFHFSLIIILLVGLGYSSPARADDTRYQNFIVGGRSVSLGGAFTSIADDASGIYYNPAGLADVRLSNVQLSSSLYGFERGTVNKDALTLPVPGVENLDVQFTDLIVVPASAGFVKAIGKPGNDGLPRQGYGVSVVVPSYRSYTITSPRSPALVNDGELLVADAPAYRRRVTDRSLWSGVGYGRRFGERLRLGVSAFYVLRSLVDVEDVATSATIRGSEEQVFRSASNEITLINGSVLFTAGFKYQLAPRWMLGASLRTPALQIHSQSQLSFRRGDAIPACPVGVDCSDEPILADGPKSRFENVVVVNAKSRSPMPASARVGLNYTRANQFTVAVDAQAYAPMRYTMLEVAPELRSRMPFNPKLKREPVVNFNVGGEYYIIREVSVSGGFFTNFSNAPKIPNDPREDYAPDVDLLGLTMAIGYFGKHSVSRLGVNYSFGAGQDVLPSSDVNRLLQDEQAFQRVDYFQSFFYIFLSSSFRY